MFSSEALLLGGGTILLLLLLLIGTMAVLLLDVDEVKFLLAAVGAGSAADGADVLFLFPNANPPPVLLAVSPPILVELKLLLFWSPVLPNLANRLLLPDDAAADEANNGASSVVLMPPPPKLNVPAPPPVAAVEDGTTALLALELVVAKPEANDKALDADLDVPPIPPPPNPENGSDDDGVVVFLVLLLLLSPPLDGAVEGNADMNDEPNILLTMNTSAVVTLIQN